MDSLQSTTQVCTDTSVHVPCLFTGGHTAHSVAIPSPNMPFSVVGDRDPPCSHLPCRLLLHSNPCQTKGKEGVPAGKGGRVLPASLCCINIIYVSSSLPHCAAGCHCEPPGNASAGGSAAGTRRHIGGAQRRTFTPSVDVPTMLCDHCIHLTWRLSVFKHQTLHTHILIQIVIVAGWTGLESQGPKNRIGNTCPCIYSTNVSEHLSCAGSWGHRCEQNENTSGADLVRKTEQIARQSKLSMRDKSWIEQEEPRAVNSRVQGGEQETRAPRSPTLPRSDPTLSETWRKFTHLARMALGTQSASS